MSNIYIKNGFRFVLLMVLQVFVLNNLSIWGFLIPYVYLLFILLLPFNTGKSWLLLLGFFSGLTIDFFGNTPGLHAAAATLMTFARPGVLRFYFQNIEYTEREEPSINKLGVFGFLKYTFTLVLIHHTALFFLEIFGFHSFLNILLQIVENTVYTTGIIIILVLFFTSRK